MFMDSISVREVMFTLKVKNSVGFDRIPQRILVDGVDFLAPKFAKLFALIYEQKQVPAQWLVAKTVPILKNKGDPKDIEN